MSQGWTGATDRDWFRDPRGVVARARGTPMETSGWRLDAPGVVPFDRVSTVPLVLQRSLSLAEDAATNWVREATLVVCREEDGAVDVGNALGAGDLPWEAPSGAVVPEDGARVSGVEFIDGRRVVPGIAWREGSFVARVLVGARHTEPVRFALRRAVPRDPEVEALLGARRALGFPRAVQPPRGAQGEAPFYRAGRHSPRVQGLGIGLTVLREGQAMQAWGALRAVPRAREWVRDDDPGESHYAARRGAAWVDVGAPGAVAVLPVTVLARHPRLATPTVFALQVPGYTAPRADGSVEAFFGVDLISLGLPRLEGPWTFWAVSGAHLAGPVTP